MMRLDFQALVSLCLAILGSSGFYTAIVMNLVRLLMPMGVVVFRFFAGGVFLIMLMFGFVYIVPRLKGSW